MAFTFAVAGKGGIGKTTLAALIVQLLIERGDGPVLAVDADPNATLAMVLGRQVEKTIGEMRDDLLDHIRKLPVGMTKDDYLEMGIQECLNEGQGADLLVMGRGEGPRCYCAVNSVLRRCIDRLRVAYKYVVIDNEAGLEHLSRCTTQDIDVLLIVSTKMPVALQSAQRVHQLVAKLALNIGSEFLVLNNTNGSTSDETKLLAEKAGLLLLGSVPSDNRIIELALQGRPVSELGEDSPARQAVKDMLNAVLAHK